jgi:coproporphyrinogen III oxidase
MSDLLEQRKLKAAKWFENLRNQICEEFEKIDGAGHFERKKWTRAAGGGGEISLMKGKVFEKVGVNISTVFGEFSPEFAKQIPGADKDPRFFATGISLVAHMSSPLVPAVHMNTRFIVTTKSWFGGGSDLTPMYANEKDTADFHLAFKQVCDAYDDDYYAKFSKWCDDYFYLPHRKEPRGIGGIFYDYLDTGDWERDFAFTQDVGKTFKEVYSELVRRHKDKPFTDEQRQHQLRRRGRYVEFNLLYDRGTKFGIMTDGNPEAILMSLPPLVAWD